MAISSTMPTPVDALPVRLFSRRENSPLLTDVLWRIERGAVRKLTWSEEGEIAPGRPEPSKDII